MKMMVRPALRPLIAAAALIAAIALVLTGGVAHAQGTDDPDEPEEPESDFESRDLGPANFTVNVRSAEFGTMPDGTEVVFATSNGEPATFSVVDLMSGEQIFAESLDYELGGFVLQVDDGMVYFTARDGSGIGLFTFDPAQMQVDQLDVDLQGQRVMYGAEIDEDGVFYFGTYPHARVMGYDTVAQEIIDYGSLTDEAGYAFSVGLVGDELWAGTGPTPYLFRLDPGAQQEPVIGQIEPPDFVMDGAEWFIEIDEREGLVFVRLSPRGGYDMAVYDLEQDEWLETIIEGTFDTPVSQVVDGAVYFLVDGILTGFDMSQQETFDTGFADSWVAEEIADAVGTYDFTIMEFDDEDFPGHTAVGITTDGSIWRYNLDTGHADLIEADVHGSPTGAHAIGVGPDGAVYMGAYLSSGAMGRVDPDTQEVEHGHGPKQASAIAAHGDLLAVTTYPGAGLYVGSAGQEWNWGGMEHLFHLERGAPNYQDRALAMESLDGLLAVGTVPDYGQLGGALTLVNTETGDYDFHRHVVEDQSVVTLAQSGGLLFGGTSIHGGLDSTPAAAVAEVFVWDVEAGELVHSAPVIDDATVITELTQAPDGQIWGMSNTGVIFTLDPDTFDVEEVLDTGFANSNTWGRQTSLYFHQDHGYMYGNSGGTLFRIDPGSHEMDVVVETGVRGSVVDGNGQIYYTGGTNVYALDVTDTPAPAPDRVIEGVVENQDGEPIEGATVTLAVERDGEFTDVAQGSELLDPQTSSNPQTTGADGVFGWRLVEGTYQVTAQAAGCQSSTTTVAGFDDEGAARIALEVDCAPTEEPTEEPSQDPPAPEPGADEDLGDETGTGGQMPATGVMPALLSGLALVFLAGGALLVMRSRSTPQER